MSNKLLKLNKQQKAEINLAWKRFEIEQKRQYDLIDDMAIDILLNGKINDKGSHKMS